MREQIITLLQNDKAKYLTADQIYNRLQLNDAKLFKKMVKILTALEEDYVIQHDDAGHFYDCARHMQFVGVIDVKERGYGFVTPVVTTTILAGQKDVYVKDCLDAITGDKVLIRITNSDSKGLEGKIVKVVERGVKYFCGPLKRSKTYHYIIPSTKQNIKIMIKDADLGQAKIRQYVKVCIKKYGFNGLCFGEVIDIIGNPNDVGIDITTCLLQAGFNTEFNDKTLKEAKMYPKTILVDDYPKRRDFTNTCIFTIDGKDARDFDDAISLKILENGHYEVGVYIADVAHYVPPFSALDEEASTRLFSIYLPDRVIPMLPQDLSDDLCSLKPYVNRLVLAVIIEIDQNMKIIEQEIVEGIICSQARLTYDEVNEYFRSGTSNNSESINQTLMLMKELKDKLNRKRLNKGALDLETCESYVVLDDRGYAVDIKMRNRGESEQLIEEFMLLANDVVASVINWQDVPAIYRVHDEPKEERLEQFKIIASSMGYKLPKKEVLHSKMLQQVLNDVRKETSPLAHIRMFILNNLLLRCQAKARYDAVCSFHYGLASSMYTHFTSPIRRYPDLLIHRVVKHHLLMSANYPFINEDYCDKIASQATKQERLIEKLERDVMDMKKCEYMINRIGQTYKGIVAGVSNRGFYVELDNTIEGLVTPENMGTDYYLYNNSTLMWYGEYTGQVYKVGTSVNVQVIEVNKQNREIKLAVVGVK